MPYDKNFDPYAIPESEVHDPWRGHGDPQQLADRGARLGARVIDFILQIVVTVPGIALLIFVLSQAQGQQADESMVIGSIAVTGLFWVALFGVNCYFLAQNGQTLGKKVLGIKIVAEDGSPASFLKILFLRMFAVGILESLPMGIGIVVWLINAGMVLQDDQRCMHDHMAGTIVVQA